MLTIEGLNTFYGSIHALKGISLQINEGEIVTLIGNNGAGKTTTLKAISGLLRPTEGKITFKGQDITKERSDKIVGMGIIHVPEGRKIFSDLSVAENLMMGAYLRRDKDGVNSDFERVYKVFPRLKEREKQLGGTLSGGEQQMLAIGRAMMSRPHLLMLDEPSMGLAPIVVEEIFNTVGELNRQGITILVVEQNANLALSIADKAFVMETGEITLAGDAEILMHDDRVRKAYLGE
ncbi:ABC transporter ATP-binding protein [Paradesulfitobacterium aromaticivorans]